MSMALQDKGRQMTITANNNSVIYFELEQKNSINILLSKRLFS